MKQLRVDNTSLTLSLEEFLGIVDAYLAATNVVAGFNQQFIIDARPTPQFRRTAPSADPNRAGQELRAL